MAKISTHDKLKRFAEITAYVAKEHAKKNTTYLDAKLRAASHFGVCQTTVERAIRAANKK